MKTFFGAALGALLLSASAMAATPSSPASLAPQGSGIVGVFSTPYTEHAIGSEQMPTFDYAAPVGEPADPVVVSTPQFAGHSEGSPVFNYQQSVPMIAVVSGIAHQGPSLPDNPVTLREDAAGGR